MTKRLIKRILPAQAVLFIVGLAILISCPANAFASTPILHEHLNAGQDADSAHIYGSNWAYMQFTADNISHTVTSIGIYVERVLLPGIVTVSLRKAAAGIPTGSDLVSTTFNGDTIATTYVMYSLPITETTLEANRQYAIVVRATAGTAANYIMWGADNTGSLANAIYGTSTDGSLTFAVDAGTDDCLFEIWGNPCIEILSAKVFANFQQANDWLFVADVNNIYVPYYPNGDPQLYFQLQVVDNVTIKGSVDFKAWQKQPMSIYMNAATAGTLAWGSTYKIRIQALFDTGVFSVYTLVPIDWTAGSLLYLNSHVRTLASTYETYYTALNPATPTVYLISTAGQSEKVLNEAGSIIFIRGIPGLETASPSLFYTSFGVTQPADTAHVLLAPDPLTALGPDAYGRINDVALLAGTDVQTVMGWGLLGLALLIGLGCVGVGHGIAGLVIGLFFAGGAGFVFGGISIALLGVIGFVFLMLIAIWLARLLFSSA